MSFDTHAPLEKFSRQEHVDESSFLGRAERLKHIKEQLGFYPQSNEETSRITALLGSGEEFATLRHLNEVYVHQRRFEADAPRAVRSVVRSFEDYAGNAVNEGYYMQLLLDQLLAVHPNNRTGFKSLFPNEDWRYDTTQIAIFSAMSRYLETDRFAETEDDDRLGKQKLLDQTMGEERFERLHENLDGLRASDIKRIALGIRTNQNNRFEYWTTQLEASKKHLFARDVATVALENLTQIR